MSDPDSKSETDKDEETWKRMGVGDLDKITVTTGQSPRTSLSHVNKPVNQNSLEGTRGNNFSKSINHNHNNNNNNNNQQLYYHRSPENETPLSKVSGVNGLSEGVVKRESGPGQIRLPTAALTAKASRHRKEAGIPVGIAVAWQRLVTTASASPTNNTVCTTMSSLSASCSPPLVKGGSKVKTPSQSPVPKRPPSTCSTPGGTAGIKDKSKCNHVNFNGNGGSNGNADPKSRPPSVPRSPHGLAMAAKCGESQPQQQQQPPHYPYGALKGQYSDWPPGLNVPHLPQNYSAAAAAAYVHHQQVTLQHHHHHLQHQLQLSQAAAAANHYVGAPAPHNYYHSAYPPDALHKYEQYLHHQAELQRQQELHYHHHHLHHQLQQQEYDIHRATPIPSPRINIPSPSPTLHSHTALWPPELLHPSSATLSPKSLASTPSPVSVQDSFLNSTTTAMTAMPKGKTVPICTSSASPPSRRVQSWREVKIQPVSKKVIKKCEKFDSPVGMEEDVVKRETSSSSSGSSVGIPTRKHDFTRLESLIEKRDEVSLPLLYSEAGMYGPNGDSHRANHQPCNTTNNSVGENKVVLKTEPVNPKSEYVGSGIVPLSYNGCNSSGSSSSNPPLGPDLKPLGSCPPSTPHTTSTTTTTTVKTEIKSEEINSCDSRVDVVGVGMLVPEVKISVSHPLVVKMESVNSVGTDLSSSVVIKREPVQVLPAESTTTSPSQGSPSSSPPPLPPPFPPICQENKKKLTSHGEKRLKSDYFDKIPSNGLDKVSSTKPPSTKPVVVKEEVALELPILADTKKSLRPQVSPFPLLVTTAAAMTVADSQLCNNNTISNNNDKKKKNCITSNNNNNNNDSSTDHAGDDDNDDKSVTNSSSLPVVKQEQDSPWNSLGPPACLNIMNNNNNNVISNDNYNCSNSNSNNGSKISLHMPKVETDSPATKCDIDINVAPLGSLISPGSTSTTNNLANSDTNSSNNSNSSSSSNNNSNSNSSCCNRPEESRYEYQQKIIGNMNNYHLLNVSLSKAPSPLPLPPPPHSQQSSLSPPSSPPLILAPSPERKKIKAENGSDTSSSEQILSHRFHLGSFLPIAEESNHLDLLATVAQEFGNEIGLRKKTFCTGTSSPTTVTATATLKMAPNSPVTTTTSTLNSLEEERSVPEKSEPCDPFSPVSDEDEDESLPSLPHSRSTSPTIPDFPPISSHTENTGLAPVVQNLPSSGGGGGRPTVAPLVLRIPQIKPVDPAVRKLKKSNKTSRKKKDEMSSTERMGIPSGKIKKKKKKSSSSPHRERSGSDAGKLKMKNSSKPRVSNPAELSSQSQGPTGCPVLVLDSRDKAVKKSKKENVQEFWEPGELRVAPLKLTKRRSTTDAIVMKKGTACSFVGDDTSRNKIKKQRYSIESTSVPFIWSRQSQQQQHGRKTDHHEISTTTDRAVMKSKSTCSSNSNSISSNNNCNSNHNSDKRYMIGSFPYDDGLSGSTTPTVVGQSDMMMLKMKKKKKKMKLLDYEDEERMKPSQKPNAVSQDLSSRKTKKKSRKQHPDSSSISVVSFSFTDDHPGLSNVVEDDNESLSTADDGAGQVVSPASSNVENDWAANPTYAVTAIKAIMSDPDSSVILNNSCNMDDNHHGEEEVKKVKPSKLTLANLNHVNNNNESEGRGLKQQQQPKKVKSSSHIKPFVMPVSTKTKTSKQNGHSHHHIKPCLKAEPVRRSSTSPENDFFDEDGKDETVDIISPPPEYSEMLEDNVGNGEEGGIRATAAPREELKVKIESVEEMLNEMRVLTEIQGLFYTGKLNALQPPDVYGVTLDNERGAPPHLIFSAEEVLEKCIRELKPEPEALVHGLRICAYWSPQYSGLYPGKVSQDYMPSGDPYNELIPIEFDDGDTGVIKLNEIRLLSPDHPIREYDPNPLLTLEKKHRKRRHSSATGSQMSGCTGDHEEADCGEAYCAKMGKLEDEGKERHSSSKLLYWTWKGLGFKRSRSKKDRNKEFFEGIQRGDEIIKVGDSALFISSGNDRPFIGRVEKFWEKKGQKVVKVRWYYHPDEVKSSKSLKGLYTGALFESPHIDENDVQTIAKKCDVLPFEEFKERAGCLTKWSRSTSQRGTYYVTGFYDPYTYNLQLKDLK